MVDSIVKNEVDTTKAQNLDSRQRNSGVSRDTSRFVREKVDLDHVVEFNAKDSIILFGRNHAVMYGGSKIIYGDIDMSASQISMDMDSSQVQAIGVLDSIGEVTGSPVFKDNSGEYESREMKYNFKTKRGYITDIVTEQGEGYLTGGITKKTEDDYYYIKDGRYTTCEDHEHPHFYFQLTKAKVKPKKNVVTGPAYMVLEDLPLPIAVPFGYFPFSEKYQSGILVPTFGEDYNRGFYLRNGGYYMALGQHADLAITGEIYTRGSWGLSAQSSYSWRYKFSGSFSANYLTQVGVNVAPLTVMFFTLYGMPLLYNGQEVAQPTILNYFNRNSINWQVTSANRPIVNTIRALIALKHTMPALADGSATTRGATSFLATNRSSVIAYRKSKGDNSVLVVINFGNSETDVTLSGIAAGNYTRVLDSRTITSGFNTEDVYLSSSPVIHLPAKGYQVYVSPTLPTNDPTALDLTPFPLGEGRGEALKFLYNGQILLLSDNKIYTAQGALLKTNY